MPIFCCTLDSKRASTYSFLSAHLLLSVCTSGARPLAQPCTAHGRFRGKVLSYRPCHARRTTSSKSRCSAVGPARRGMRLLSSSCAAAASPPRCASDASLPRRAAGLPPTSVARALAPVNSTCQQVCILLNSKKMLG
jgi:hypothetical protein